MESVLKSCRKYAAVLVLGITLLLAAGQSQAAANVIANAENVSGGSFVTNSKGIRYRLKNGTYLKNKWARIGGKVYRFRMDSYVFRGWRKYPAGYYYADAKGVIYHKQWLRQGTRTYFLRYNGLRAENMWIILGGKYYRFGSTGLLLKNTTYKVNGKTYYANAAGQRVSSAWVKIGGKKYYFASNGARVEGRWITYKGRFFYLNKGTGALAVNTKVGKYYVGADGARLVNCYYQGYYYDSNGVRDEADAKRVQKAKTAAYLFVGDSRTVGMEEAVTSSKAVFLGKVGEGYSWLSGTADAQIRYLLKVNPKLKVVFGFGINDLHNIDLYIQYYQKLMKAYPNVSFYFMSINPYDASKWTSKWLSDAGIQAFNKKLKAAMGSRYLDVYSYIKKKGFSTLDGLHYTAASSILVYQNACYQILKQQ